MTKILEIESCGECPCLGSYQPHGEVITYCMECDLDQDNITDLNTIPDWCPLRDKPEPLTGDDIIEFYKKASQKDGEDIFDELARLFNAHFLGEECNDAE